MQYTAYIGLGSNLDSPAGDPAETVTAATGELSALGKVGAQSSLYRTAPVGYREQPSFVNAVVRLQTDLEPEQILDKMLEIERRFGRDRRASIPKGPRTLDLDLLLVFREKEQGDAEPISHESPTLSLPHPEIANRRFVIEPLTEIAPDLQHPDLHQCMRELRRRLAAKSYEQGNEVVKL